jgi:hypothetical protein
VVAVVRYGYYFLFSITEGVVFVAYITVAQFLRLYDSRRVAQLLSDSGIPVVSGDLATNENLIDILAIASEQIAAAVIVGKRYTLQQLEDLAENEDYGFLLRRLVADLAWAGIVSRRGTGATELQRLCPSLNWCEQQLDMLRLGQHIFPGIEDADHPAAGLPSSANINATSNPNRVSKFTDKASRLFPFDCNRLNTETGC